MDRKPLLCILLSSFLQLLVANNFPVDFIPINNRITIHRSYEMVGNYKTPSNGLIIETDQSVILIDTAWNDEETEQIVKYVKETINKPIIACIITHFHQDRCGGIYTINKNQIPLYIREQTSTLIDQKQKGFIYLKLVNGYLEFDNIVLDIEYFGKAHSPDNITVYVVNYDILFGGCLIKSDDSTSIGNIADADLVSWKKVINMIKKKYTGVKIVIPGHGESGGPELFDHTLSLLR